tara:strand:- start:18 stop:581 length:564 start_codon:yes stop_codon:yes gene_type:complete
MYTIIDQNNELHGPVDEETIRQWISEGRVGPQTLIRKNDSSSSLYGGNDEENFQTASSFPEFADEVSGGEAGQEESFQPPGQDNPPPIGAAVSPQQFQPQGTNGMAIAGMVLGILSIPLLIGCYGVPFNILGTIFSCVALGQIKRNPQQGGRGMAIAGLVCSLVSIGLVLILLVVVGFMMTGPMGRF